MSAKRYVAAGFAVILVAVTMAVFVDGEDRLDPDHTGVVSDISESTSGYVFYLNTYNDRFRCYCSSCPVDLGYYGVTGSFSDDGSIFFVSFLIPLETYFWK